jgi:hypothetical protein
MIRHVLKLVLMMAMGFSEAGLASAAIENRTGFVEYRITIQNTSLYSGKLRCSGSINAGARKTPTEFLGGSWTTREVVRSISSNNQSLLCIVKIPFNWTYADIDSNIRGSVNVWDYSCGSCSLTRIGVSLGVRDFPYPPNGGTARVFVSLSI